MVWTQPKLLKIKVRHQLQRPKPPLAQQAGKTNPRRVANAAASAVPSQESKIGKLDDVDDIA
ncbi:hypothetical protein ACLOJK_035249 [Asimina triloba]